MRATRSWLPGMSLGEKSSSRVADRQRALKGASNWNRQHHGSRTVLCTVLGDGRRREFLCWDTEAAEFVVAAFPGQGCGRDAPWGHGRRLMVVVTSGQHRLWHLHPDSFTPPETCKIIPSSYRAHIFREELKRRS